MFRIGSAEGFYGDDVTRALPMIEGGHVDVVCFEALSELTLAILRRDQMRDPRRGLHPRHRGDRRAHPSAGLRA